MVLECQINGCNPNVRCEWANHLNQCLCLLNGQWHPACPDFECSDHRKYGPNCDQTCPCPGAQCNHNGICSHCFKTYTGPKCEICVCQNGGTCDGDRCLCQENFYGDFCEIPICYSEISNYNEITNTCDCHRNYGGPNCRYCKCQNGGTCNGDQCVCSAGFSGDFCEISKCDRETSNYNNMTDKCECQKIYEGQNCESCKCQNGGVCNGAKCLCTRYFKGEFCDVGKCENGGSFNGQNCTCPENHNGTFCEKPKCKHGRRVLEGISNYFCNCPKNYDGAFCENCKCKNGGTCAFDGCDCPPSFEGDFCEQPKCQSGERINFGDSGKCVCPSEFSGVFCENFDIENTIFFGKKKRLHDQYPKQRNKF
jgi:hypothetical protein